MEPSTQKTKKTGTKKVPEQTTLFKNSVRLLPNISPSLLINILILLLTAFGTYFAVIGNMDSRLDKAIDAKVSKYQEKLDNLIAKGEEINDINAKTKDNQRIIVALISDFGSDNYNLQVIKGKILQNNKRTNIIDITHDIRPFDEIEGAWILHNATKNLPEEAIIWGMVNPGAKLSDNSIFLITNRPKQYFIGASKSLFDNVIASQGLKTAYKPIFIDDDDKYGTTTFTELINVLQNGGTVDELKDKHLIQRDSIEYEPVLPTTKSPIWKDNSVSGYVCSIDRWGNILTNIKLKSPFFQIGKKYSVEINSKKITNFVYGKDYSAGEGKAGVIIDQDDWIQVAVYLGYANKSFEINKTGDKITICKEN